MTNKNAITTFTLITMLSAVASHAQIRLDGDGIPTDLTSPSVSSPLSPKTKPRRAGCECGLWKVSVAAMHAGVGLDVASSWQRPELNPMYRSADGRFGTQGLTLRLAIPVGAAMLQRFVLARTDARWVRRTFTVVNFFSAGTSTAVAVRNWRLE